MSPITKPDIAIVGGGPSGLAFAAICERRGYSYIVYERSARDTPPRGGCLDLHPGSGQRAMKEAGVFSTFQKYARGGTAAVHRVFNRLDQQVFSWGEGRDSPEIDRDEIKETLLTGIPEDKIVWRKKLESAKRDDRGKIVLKFEDGETASGFKLIVGADGTFSKVRPLITSVSPKPFGSVVMEGAVAKTNPFWERLYQEVGEGPTVVMGRQTMMWIQIQGRGQYNIGAGIWETEDFVKNHDFDDVDAIKALLLSDRYFGKHAQRFKDMINACDQPFRPWPLMEMPPEALCWEPSSDVTLIGDSAHTTTPFIGDGANCAMRDAVILADKLDEHGIGLEAVAAYERDMFPLAMTMIQNSHYSGKLFYDPDAPEGFLKAMEKHNFIGDSDGY